MGIEEEGKGGRSKGIIKYLRLELLELLVFLAAVVVDLLLCFGAGVFHALGSV